MMLAGVLKVVGTARRADAWGKTTGSRGEIRRQERRESWVNADMRGVRPEFGGKVMLQFETDL